MKTSIVFLVVAVALVAGQFDIARIAHECTVESSLPAGQLDAFIAATDKANYNASPELKCFAKCATEKSGLVVDGKVNEQKFFALGTLTGKDEPTLRANLERCRGLYKPSGDCEDYWKLYTCFKTV